MSQKPVIAALDLTEQEDARRIAEEALAQAKLRGVAVHFLNVLPFAKYAYVQPYIPQEAIEASLAAATKDLADLVGQLQVGDTVVTQNVRQGSVYEEVMASAEKRQAGLIVMSARRPGVTEYLLGSNAVQISRHAKCSVLLIRGDD